MQQHNSIGSGLRASSSLSPVVPCCSGRGILATLGGVEGWAARVALFINGALYVAYLTAVLI